jgi:hypothetical protein
VKVRSLVVWSALGALSAVALPLALASPPRVVEIKVPEPTKPPPLPPPPAPTIGPNGEVIPAPEPASHVAVERVRPGVRREVRKVEGEAPTTLWGRYDVVEVTENDETEDFVIKMEREGKALDQDCITTRRVFDFGPSNGTLPPVLQVAEQERCSKGGLGVYDSEIALAMTATWGQGENAATLEMPAVVATASLVRVRKPDKDDLHTPSHWLGPETRVDRPITKFRVVAEIPKARRPTDPPPAATAIHLVAEDGTVWHLEPEPPDSPFAK